MRRETDGADRERMIVCGGFNCWRRGAGHLARRLRRAGQVGVVRTDCLKMCVEAPVVVRYPAGLWYGRLQGSDVDRLLDDRGTRPGASHQDFLPLVPLFILSKKAGTALPESPSDLD